MSTTPGARHCFNHGTTAGVRGGQGPQTMCAITVLGKRATGLPITLRAQPVARVLDVRASDRAQGGPWSAPPTAPQRLL